MKLVHSRAHRAQVRNLSGPEPRVRRMRIGFDWVLYSLLFRCTNISGGSVSDRIKDSDQTGSCPVQEIENTGY